MACGAKHQLLGAPTLGGRDGSVGRYCRMEMRAFWQMYFFPMVSSLVVTYKLRFVKMRNSALPVTG